MFRRKDKPGFYQGKHYTEHVEQVKALKRADKLADAEKLLLALIAAVETESLSKKAPWYTEQLAIVYRKQLRYADEVAVLERFNRGEKQASFAERIAKAKALSTKT